MSEIDADWNLNFLLLRIYCSINKTSELSVVDKEAPVKVAKEKDNGNNDTERAIIEYF